MTFCTTVKILQTLQQVAQLQGKATSLKHPNTFHAVGILARVLMSRGEHAEAVREFNQEIELAKALYDEHLVTLAPVATFELAQDLEERIRDLE
jgi:hypothetical protein